MSSSSQNESFVYLLATALFMADDQGKYVLLDKELPVSVGDVIKEHILRHLNSTIRNKAIIKVVPKPDHLQPFQFHPNTMRLDLRKMESRKNFFDNVAKALRDFWDYDIMQKGRGRTKKKKNASMNANMNTKQFGNDEKAKQFNKTEKAKQFGKGEGFKKTNVTRGQPTSPNDYVPNDIYYKIEKKCVNWSDGCQLNSPPIFDHPSSTFKFSPGVIMPPKFELYDP